MKCSVGGVSNYVSIFYPTFSSVINYLSWGTSSMICVSQQSVVWYSVELWGAVQSSSVHTRATIYILVQFIAVKCSEVQCSAVCPINVVWYEVQYSTFAFRSMLYVIVIGLNENSHGLIYNKKGRGWGWEGPGIVINWWESREINLNFSKCLICYWLDCTVTNIIQYSLRL